MAGLNLTCHLPPGTCYLKSMRDLSKILILTGVVLIAAGAIVRWTSLGRLPGDFVYRRGNFSFYFPLVTSILASIILTLLMMLFGRR